MWYFNKRINNVAAIFIILLLVIPLFSFSQRMWTVQSKMFAELRKTKTDTNRVHVLLKLCESYMPNKYYGHNIGNPVTLIDSACSFAEQALHLSEKLQYENGKNEAILLIAGISIQKHEIGTALNLLNRLHNSNSARFQLLIMLARHYVFYTSRSQEDLDSALLVLSQADKMALNQLSTNRQLERIHIKAMRSFITEGLQPCKKLYLEMTGKISNSGNEEREALLWYELSRLIPSRDSTAITKVYCFEKMVSLYRKAGNQIGEIEALKDIADMNMVHGKLDLAEAQLLNLLDRYKAVCSQKLHDIYDLLGGAYRNKGDFSKALFYGLKTIDHAVAVGDTGRNITFFSRIANIYRELGQPEKSVEWYWKIFRERKPTESYNMYMFRDAGFLVRELIKLKREKEALAFLLDSKAKHKPIGVYAKASLLGSLAYCYHVMNQQQLTDKYYLELINLTEQLQKNNEITTDVHYEIGQYFISKKEYAKAAIFFHKALSASEGINNPSETKNIYLMLYKTYSALENYKFANIYLMKNKELSDSLFTVAKSKQIEELQVQYETAKKQKNIELLNKQNQLHRLKAEKANRTKDITLVGGALLLIITGLLFNRYRIKQRSNRELEAHRKELDQKNVFLEALNTEQNKLLKEKEWLIREVHHRVKNNLQLVTSLLNTQSAYLKDDTAIDAVRDSLRRMQAMSMIHQKLYQDENTSTISMPDYINELVRYLRASFETANRIIFEQTIESIELDVTQAIPLGLIINESIVNAIKYAFLNGEKGIVRINLQRDGADYLLLNISDNGIGLPAGFDLLEYNSLGLELMQGLAKQLNGTFIVESNNGVHILVRFTMHLPTK